MWFAMQLKTYCTHPNKLNTGTKKQCFSVFGCSTVLIAFTGSLVTAAASTAGKSDKNVRLPRTVLPRHYDVRLFSVLEKGNFTIPGRVSIDLECKEKTDRTVLHSADIVVEPKSVRVHLSRMESNSYRYFD